jgi:tellurite resistance protein
MRAAATAILRAGSVSDPAVRAAVEPLRAVAAHLTPEAREGYLAGALRIGLADGPLTPAERDGLQWIAGHLGMTPAHTQGVIWTVERSVTPG